MKPCSPYHLIACVLALSALPLLTAEPAPQPLRLHAARASSVYDDFTADKAIDGVIDDASRWVSAPSKTPAWLEFDLGATHALAGVHRKNPADLSQPKRLQPWSVETLHRTYAPRRHAVRSASG